MKRHQQLTIFVDDRQGKLLNWFKFGLNWFWYYDLMLTVY